MERTRKRRRCTCQECGTSFSYSWYREHKANCGTAQNNDSSECCESDISANINSNNGFECQSSASSECDSSDEVSGVEIPTDIADQFSDMLQRRQFEQEDRDFFGDAEEMLADEKDVEPPPTESWEDLNGDEEEDFDMAESEATQESSTCSSNLEVLVLWLMLFLSSWQSNHGVTDTALGMLIKFLSHLFWLIGAFDNTMATMARLFPNSLYKLRKTLGMSGDNFIKYVVCPKCKSIYKYEDCVQIRAGLQVSAKCKFVAWPNHPHKRRRGKSKQLPQSEFLLVILFNFTCFPFFSAGFVTDFC